MALASVCILIMAGGALIASADDASAVGTLGIYTGGQSQSTPEAPYTGIDTDAYHIAGGVHVAVGSNVTIRKYADESNMIYETPKSISPSDCGLSIDGTTVTGTITSACIFELICIYTDVYGEEEFESSAKFTAVPAPTTYTVTYDSAGGSAVASSVVTVGSSTYLPGANRDGHVFGGWYTAASGGAFVGNAGDSYIPSSNVTLYAHWTAASVTIQSSPGNLTAVSGQGWSYIVTASPSDAVISVTGATWLSVAGGNVVTGTVGPAGDYTVTVTASKAGWVQATQTFTVHVVTELAFTSSPSSGFVMKG